MKSIRPGVKLIGGVPLVAMDNQIPVMDGIEATIAVSAFTGNDEMELYMDRFQEGVQ